MQRGSKALRKAPNILQIHGKGTGGNEPGAKDHGMKKEGLSPASSGRDHYPLGGLTTMDLNLPRARGNGMRSWLIPWRNLVYHSNYMASRGWSPRSFLGRRNLMAGCQTSFTPIGAQPKCLFVASHFMSLLSEQAENCCLAPRIVWTAPFFQLTNRPYASKYW